MDTHIEADLLSRFSRRKVLSLTCREYDWVLALEDETQLVIECLWRLIEAGRVRFTSQDHGQLFGLPAPVDAAAEANRRIAGQLVRQVELRAGTLDLELHLEHGLILQIIPDSSGYEAWNVSCPIAHFSALGGGELAMWRTPPSRQ